MSENLTKEDVLICKVVLLGESSVGKTCIITRFIDNLFQQDVITTTGASYAAKSILYKDYHNKIIKFEIWDTAGQEKYRSLTQIFYKDAAIAILVYDITSEKSFEEMENYWYKQIREFAPPNIIIGIAGNKFDLFNDEKIPEDKAKNFAKEAGGIFRYTSAKESVGIQELFVLLGLKYLDPNFVDDGKFLPQTNLAGINNENNNNGKNRNRGESIKLNKEKIKEKKKKFC
jgi:small GTP-binding protein